jgi:RNA 3'-terminal phosphate cyclase
MGFDGILGRGKEETTEKEIIQRANSELNTSATVDTKTAEQIIPWLAISTAFYIRVPHLTEHLETALWLIESLLKKKIIVRRYSDCVTIFLKGI